MIRVNDLKTLKTNALEITVKEIINKFRLTFWIFCEDLVKNATDITNHHNPTVLQDQNSLESLTNSYKYVYSNL